MTVAVTAAIQPSLHFQNVQNANSRFYLWCISFFLFIENIISRLLLYYEYKYSMNDLCKMSSSNPPFLFSSLVFLPNNTLHTEPIICRFLLYMMCGRVAWPCNNINDILAYILSMKPNLCHDPDKTARSSNAFKFAHLRRTHFQRPFYSPTRAVK